MFVRIVTRHLVAVLTILSVSTGPALCQRGTVYVKDLLASPGQIANVQIWLDSNVRGVAAAQLRIDFSTAQPPTAPIPRAIPADPSNPGNGEADFQLGPIVPTGMFSMASALGPGNVELGFAGTRDFDGPGCMAVIPLQIPADVPGRTTYQIGLSVITLNDRYIRHIDADVKGGTLTVVPTRTVRVGSTTVSPSGGDVRVALLYKADDDSPMGGLAGEISISPKQPSNPPAAAVVTVSANPAIPHPSLFITPLGPSRARFLFLSSIPIPSGLWLAKVTLRVPPGAKDGSTYSVSLESPLLYDPTGRMIPVDAVPGEIQVQAAPGDLDADGRITVLDAGLCLRIALNLAGNTDAATLKRADVAPANPGGTAGDGRVNISDVLRVLRRALGLEPDPWP